MGQIVRPGSASSGGSFRWTPRDWFVATIVRTHGVRGLLALLLAAIFGFLPLALLVWFQYFSRSPLVATTIGPRVVVKPERLEQESDDDEPGETALLVVKCEAPSIDGWRELRRYDDPARNGADSLDHYYVRREQVYLRPVTNPPLPFVLLGKPPLCVWVPAGDYEILVVHDAPATHSYVEPRPRWFPLVTVFDSCSVEANRKTVRRIRLPHYDWGGSEPIVPAAENTVEAELQPLLAAVENLSSFPTLGGVVLELPEPTIEHSDDHRRCTIDFTRLNAFPREWSRDQVATVRNWLPDDAGLARTKLSAIVASLQWREFFAGWFSYLVAGIAGLVLTRWGALAILQPYGRRTSLPGALKLLAGIFLLSILVLFLASRWIS